LYELYPSEWLAYAEKYVEVTQARGLVGLRVSLRIESKRLKIAGRIQIVPEVKTQWSDGSLVPQSHPNSL
jgi:hypothetical protein